MTTEQAVRWAGGVKELAAALGIWAHAIYRWGEYPPKVRQYQIELFTKGGLVAEGSRPPLPMGDGGECAGAGECECAGECEDKV